MKTNYTHTINGENPDNGNTSTLITYRINDKLSYQVIKRVNTDVVEIVNTNDVMEAHYIFFNHLK
jgi:hypothetical protein